MILRSGWRTTELALAVLSAAACAVTPSSYSLCLALISVGYSVSRGIAKIGKARFADINGVKELLAAEERQACAESYQKAIAAANAEGRAAAAESMKKQGVKLPENWR